MSETRQSIGRGVGLVLVALVAIACRPPFEFDEWAFPLPETIVRHGYFPPTDEQRRAEPSIELVEELVVGDAEGDFEYMFGRTPPRIAVAADGRIAVLDGGNHRVQVYDADGAFVATMGRQGQGPGEFGQVNALLIEGDELVVWDVVHRRATRWSWDGDLVGSNATDMWGGLIVQVEGGDRIWRAIERYPDRQDTTFVRVRADGSQVVEYARTPWPQRTIDPPLGEIVGTEPDAWWVGTVAAGFAATAGGPVFVSPFDEYQIFAYEPGGTMVWALQVAGERPPISAGEIDYFMEIHNRRFPNRSAAMVDWPERQYALADLKVDGHGHLYVFPYSPKGTPADEPRFVDVYSPEGERLYSGTISGRMFTTAYAMYNGPMLEVAWQAARDDRVWGLAENAETGNREVVRYRLVEPF